MSDRDKKKRKVLELLKELGIELNQNKTRKSQRKAERKRLIAERREKAG